VATYALIHGGGDRAWAWHLVAAELRERGHDVVAVDMPSDDGAGLWDYAGTVVDAVGERSEVIVVAHSLGGFSAPLVCAHRPVRLLVLLAAMVPNPGETVGEWWAETGYRSPGIDDPVALFYHDVDPALAREALAGERGESARAMSEPWPLAAWPAVPTRFLLCGDDRVFPADWLRGVVRERLGIEPDEMDGGHYPLLSRPRALVDRLEAYRDDVDAADFYDVELRAHNEHLRRAAAVHAGARVLDVGCGTGLTTREAARAAAPAEVVGVDVSALMVQRARQLAEQERLENVRFVVGDAQTHRFDEFDLAISRFGLMFFSDPPAAFANIRGALRPGGRLVALVWQAYERNEWATELALGREPFSLGDPDATRRLLERAGFCDVRLEEVREAMYFGPDVDAALWWVRRFCTPDAAVLAAHHGAGGVLFDSRAWIVSATTSA
jgi:SAM-dependent methyltransferase